MRRWATLAVLLAAAAAALGAFDPRAGHLEYGPLADALRAGEGLSRQLPDGRWIPSAFVEPYYPALLAALDTTLGGTAGHVALVLLQIAALLTAAALVARVAAPHLALPPSWIAACVALWPPLVAASMKVHPQAFRALLLASLLAAADAWWRATDRRGRLRAALFFGAALGACVWARAPYLAPALLLLAFVRPRPATALPALALALAIAAPWWVRNAVAFDAFVPFTTNGGLNLAMGNHPGATGEANARARIGARALLAPPSGNEIEIAPANEREGDALLARAAIRHMWDEPGGAVSRWARKLAYLVWMRPGAGERYPLVLVWGYVLFAAVTTPLIALGAARASPRGRAWLVGPALTLLAVVALFAVNQRYRAEADVLLAPLALLGGVGAWRWFRERAPSWRRRSGAAAAASCIVLFAIPAGALAGRAAVLAQPLIRDDGSPPQPPHVDAVFVASGDVDFHRTAYAVEVFHRTGARWMLFSGAGSGGDSGELMAAEAVRLGVSRDAIRLETSATTTRENALFARRLVHEVGALRVAVVTDPLHSRRFALACERAWPDVDVSSLPVPAERDPFGCGLETWRDSPRCRGVVTTEWKKLLGYLALGWL